MWLHVLVSGGLPERLVMTYTHKILQCYGYQDSGVCTLHWYNCSIYSPLDLRFSIHIFGESQCLQFEMMKEMKYETLSYSPLHWQESHLHTHTHTCDKIAPDTTIQSLTLSMKSVIICDGYSLKSLNG